MMRGTKGPSAAIAVTAPASAQFPQDPDLAKAMTLVETLNSTMEDHTLAEDLAKAVLARKPTDAETVIVNAYVENRFILRGFDLAEERYTSARRLCERALLLAPDHPEALHVLGQFLTFRGADLPRAVELLRRAVALQPDRARFYNSYIEALETVDPKESVRVAEAAAARFPADPIIHYRLALVYAYVSGDLDAYERALDETIALGPVATAVLRKASVVLIAHRDVAAAKQWLDRVPESFRLNDRTVYIRFLVASASGEVDDALRALNALPGNFLSDFGLWPKRMLTGDLLARKGQADLARREFEGALADIARERARNPNAGLERPEKWLLLWLGREQEAKASANLTYEGVRRPLALRGITNMWFGPIGTLLVLGERAKALELLREAARDDWGRRVLAGAFALDPHLAPWRDDPEIKVLLAGPAKATVARDWPKNPELKKAVALLDRFDAIPEDLRLAEEIAQRVLDQASTDPEVVTAMARVQATWLLRGWDRSSDRFLRAQRVTERAVQLAPNEPEALAALMIYLYQRGTDLTRARQLIERAIELDPGSARLQRLRNDLLMADRTVSREEAFASLERTLERFPKDALVHYDASRYYRIAGRWEDSEREVNTTLAISPVANAMVWKARSEFGLRKNLPGMKAALDQVPARVRSIERTVFAYFIYAVMSGNHAVGVDALNDMAEPWMIDFDYHGPKALPLAALLELQGKPALARVQYEVALREVKQRQAAEPDDIFLRGVEAWILHGLGRDDEARTAVRIFNESIERPYRVGRLLSWWFHPIACNLVLGERGTALALIREAGERPEGRETVRRFLAADPRLAAFRDDPEIMAALAGQEATAAAVTATAAVPPAAIAPKNPELKRAVQLIESSEAIASDVALAEDLAKGVLAEHPTDAAATVVMGRVQVYYLVRGFDRSEDRFATAKRFAERGLALAPDDPDAMVVMATYLYRRGVELPRATKLLRAAIALRPTEPLYYRMLDNVLSISPNVTDAEIIASAKVTAERFPSDVLVQYELARHYRDAGMLAEAEHYLDVAIKLGPVANAIIARARLMLFAHGDPAGMKTLLDQLPERYRGTDRAVFSQFSYAMVTGQPQLGLDALQAMPEPWMIDFDYTGPTGLVAGELLLQQGKPGLARLRFTEALAELGRHKADFSRNFSTTWLETWLLMRLGRLDEARKRNEVYFPELSRPYRIYLGTNWWFNPLTQNLLLGEHAKAVALMREAVGFQQGRTILRNAFRLDPRMAPFRDDPEIKALLAEPQGAK